MNEWMDYLNIQAYTVITWVSRKTKLLGEEGDQVAISTSELKGSHYPQL